MMPVWIVQRHGLHSCLLARQVYEVFADLQLSSLLHLECKRLCSPRWLDEV